MIITNRWARISRAAFALSLTSLLAGAAFAAPPVNVKADRFVSAKEKNAVRAFRNAGGPKTDADVKQLAEKLNRAARVSDVVDLKDDGTNHSLHVNKQDPSGHFRIDKTTGDFSFTKGMKSYQNDQATQGLPTGDKAVEQAKRHLTDLGVMPADQKELVVRHVGGLRQVDVSADGKAVERDKLTTVHFGRQIDGLDVGGPGSKIVVDLGANGELVGLTKRWIEKTEEKKTEGDLATQSEVTNNLKARLAKDGDQAKQIDSSGPDLGYFDDGKGNIEPAYFYTAELTYDFVEGEGAAAKPHKEKHHGAVPALKGSKADFQQLEKAGKQPGKAAPVQQDKPSRKD
jgi:hypothetical protein